MTNRNITTADFFTIPHYTELGGIGTLRCPEDIVRFGDSVTCAVVVAVGALSGWVGVGADYLDAGTAARLNIGIEASPLRAPELIGGRATGVQPLEKKGGGGIVVGRVVIEVETIFIIEEKEAVPVGVRNGWRGRGRG